MKFMCECVYGVDFDERKKQLFKYKIMMWIEVKYLFFLFLNVNIILFIYV